MEVFKKFSLYNAANFALLVRYFSSLSARKDVENMFLLILTPGHERNFIKLNTDKNSRNSYASTSRYPQALVCRISFSILKLNETCIGYISIGVGT